jgi:hypothetical protein
MTQTEITIMERALPFVETAARSNQNECWPGDGPVHEVQA